VVGDLLTVGPDGPERCMIVRERHRRDLQKGAGHAGSEPDADHPSGINR
jgi:hypothetical protein